MQTLLKVTKAKVWASMVDARSFLARTRGMRNVERAIWGMKARDSKWKVGGRDGNVGYAAGVDEVEDDDDDEER